MKVQELKVVENIGVELSDKYNFFILWSEHARRTYVAAKNLITTGDYYTSIFVSFRALELFVKAEYGLITGFSPFKTHDTLFLVKEISRSLILAANTIPTKLFTSITIRPSDMFYPDNNGNMAFVADEKLAKAAVKQTVRGGRRMADESYTGEITETGSGADSGVPEWFWEGPRARAARTLQSVTEAMRSYAEVVRGKFHVVRAILFGSWVKGRATEESDIDVCFFLKDYGGLTRHEARVEILLLGEPWWLLWPESHVFLSEAMLAKGDFIREILHTGIDI